MNTQNIKLSFLLMIALLVIVSSSECQTIITRLGHVIYFNSYEPSRDKKAEVAGWINDYLNAQKKPEGYIILEIDRDDTVCGVSYDNLYGNSVYEDIYGWTSWDYTLKALKISISDFLVTKDTIIRALKFAIKKKGKLKRAQRRNKRKSYYDREDEDLIIKIP